MGKNLTKYLSIEEIHMTNKHMKRCSTALIIMLMHIKVIMTYSLTLTRRTTIKKSHRCWQRCRTIGKLVHYWWEYKMVQPL